MDIENDYENLKKFADFHWHWMLVQNYFEDIKSTKGSSTHIHTWWFSGLFINYNIALCLNRKILHKIVKITGDGWGYTNDYIPGNCSVIIKVYAFSTIMPVMALLITLSSVIINWPNILRKDGRSNNFSLLLSASTHFQSQP